jgi:DNA-binding NtrC family response regulator
LENTKKILIIDDEAYIRRVIELKLKSKGYQVFAANNGEEGIIIFNRYQPDVVITDIRMPKMNGKVFCEQTDSLKAERPFLTIIITCSISDDGWKWVDKLHETVLFEKPFSPSRLLECIDEYLGIQR